MKQARLAGLLNITDAAYGAAAVCVNMLYFSFQFCVYIELFAFIADVSNPANQKSSLGGEPRQAAFIFICRYTYG